MKKLFSLLTGLFLVITVAGSASAFTNIVELGGLNYGNDLITWTHDAPSDFEVPYDIIYSATITITYNWIETETGENVKLDGSIIGTLDTYSSCWLWGNPMDDLAFAEFDVAAELDPFDNGSLLNLSLKINESGDWSGKDYILGTSTFDLDYENGSAPVPEPATMVLFGLGLIGLAGASRKKLKK